MVEWGFEATKILFVQTDLDEHMNVSCMGEERTVEALRTDGLEESNPANLAESNPAL